MSNTTEVQEETIDLTQVTDPAAANTGKFRVLALPFIGYLLYFVGIGQIAGGVVHYPIDPSYFTMMAIIGVFVFLAGTWLNEVILPSVRPPGKKIARLVAASVVLSIGVGGVSGGFQHFLQFPTRSAVLIAAGLVIAFIGFIWKGSFTARQSVVVGLVVAAVAAITLFAMSPLAKSLESSGGGHNHGGH
ncbi:MAG: hypothetical protein WC054_10530 [Candidatus Nanopelagicales bacterium]